MLSPPGLGLRTVRTAGPPFTRCVTLCKLLPCSELLHSIAYRPVIVIVSLGRCEGLNVLIIKVK